MVAALSIVIGLILLAKYFSGKLVSGGAVTGMTSRHIRLVETRHIAPKKALLLVEVGGEYLLLASSEEGISLLKQVNVIEDIEVIEEPGNARFGLSGLLRGAGKKWRS
nr:flagellar biosynthetic protein FliO [Pelotalea chapellei]